ncbi:MAG: M6 family metalloprotease domain-containing protein [Bacteroides sp.]|nr:M6 family metalloprotease domain-containing protein [Bacteroides sp.]
MKIKHILAAMTLALPGLMAAVPADPRPRQLTNPDGSTVTVRIHGDEFFHFMSDEACTRILERDERGFIVDMLRDGAPVAFTAANVRMLTEEGRAAFAAKMPSAPAAPAGMQKMATLDTGGRSNYPTKGQGNRSLVVLVEFKDQQFTVENPKEYFTRQLNEPGFSDYGGQGSALDYYKAVSGGQYVPQFDVFGPVRLDHNASYFQDTGKPMATFIKEALTPLHESGEVDFSNYDLDEDGVVDTVFFYYAGYGSADSETATIWPHQYDYRYVAGYGNALRFDGKQIGCYACGNELKGWNPVTGKLPWQDGSEPWVDGIGTFVHEYGHVLGLPDLYDTAYEEGVEVLTPGEWSVMDAGCYNGDGCVPPLYSAYEQWVCRWLEFTDAADKTVYDLPALGHSEIPEAVRIRIPKGLDGSSFEDEYFIIEARDKSGWDESFPESGLLVWRISYNRNAWMNNTVNSKTGSRVIVHYANGAQHPAFTEGHILPGTPQELVPSASYKFWTSPMITDISYDAESKSGRFGYNMLQETPMGAPLLHDTPIADESGARNFTLVWDPVEGADSYMVTIRRVSTGKVLGVYDELNIGNATELKVVSVPIAYWNNELEAYVRAVKTIPCGDTSNVIRFVPKELPAGSNAVGGIESEGVSVSGGVGCIEAPEGAEVFDMAGKRLSKDGLAPGVYIVVYAGRSHKVAVR